MISFDENLEITQLFHFENERYHQPVQTLGKRPKVRMICEHVNTSGDKPIKSLSHQSLKYKARGKTCEQGTIGFGFTPDWLRKWPETIQPITNQCQARESVCEQGTVGFRFTPDWLREWREVLQPIANQCQARENACEQDTIGFGLTPDWLRKWCEIFQPITNRWNVKLKYL